MYFESFSALWAMEGHGPYVWSAYGVTFMVLLLLVVKAFYWRNNFAKQMRMQWRREQQVKQQSSISEGK